MVQQIMLTNQKTNKGGIMTFEEHFNNLIDTLNKRFPKLVKKHNLNVIIPPLLVF